MLLENSFEVTLPIAGKGQRLITAYGSWTGIIREVPQGSVLGPILFVIPKQIFLPERKKHL